MGTKKTCFKEIELRAQNSLTILGSTTITFGWTYMSILWERGSSLQLLKRYTYELLNYKENGYKNDLDLVIVVHYLCVSYPTSSRCKAKSVCLRKVVHQICALLRNYLWAGNESTTRARVSWKNLEEFLVLQRKMGVRYWKGFQNFSMKNLNKLVWVKITTTTLCHEYQEDKFSIDFWAYNKRSLSP